MKELRDWLKESDPVADEPPLSEGDVRRMRHAILAAPESQQPPLADWARGSWAAATVVVALTFAFGMNRWFAPPLERGETRIAAEPAVRPHESGARRQLQLIAPGGTRVIWVFNDDFKP